MPTAARPQAAAQPGFIPQTGRAADQDIGTRFNMKERIFAIEDDFYVENEHGKKVFKVDGKLFRLQDTILFEDMRGREIYRITARMVDIRETIDINFATGGTAAIVHDAWVSPVRDRWTIEIPGSPDLVAQGNILQHEYTIRRGGRMPVAVVTKKWLRIRDTYGIEVQDATDAALLLAITVVIDMMSHNNATRETASGFSNGSGLDIL